MIRLRLAAAARLRRITRGERAEDGFMLIYVLMITTIITVLVGSTLVTASGSVIPAQQAAYNQAANTAAVGGLQAFLAYADQQCKDANSTVDACILPVQDSGTFTIVQDGSYKATYRWQAAKVGGYFRVTSDGTISRGGLTAKKRLVADVAGGASTNPLDSGYVTQFETQAPDVAQALYPSRLIGLSSSALGAAGVPNTGSSVSWQGAQAGTTPGTVNTCNALFGGADGRVNNPPPNAPSPYVDWSETGNVGTASYTDFQPCQVSLGTGTQFLGPTNTALGLGEVRSQDAFLISNSYPGGTGPKLDQPTYTQYQYDPTTDGTCGTSGQNYRTFNLLCAGYSVDIGGTPAAGSYLPTHVAQLPAWPTDPPSINKNGGTTGACWYTGPTRIKFNASTDSAVITSPQTTAVVNGSNAACYGGAAPNASTGMLGVTVSGISSASNGVIYVQNNGSAPTTQTSGQYYSNTGWKDVDRTAAISATNSVFYATNGSTGTNTTTGYATTANDKPYTPTIGDTPSSQTDAAWTPQWTSDSSGTTCSTSTAVTDLRFYRCYASSGAYDATAYVDLKTAIKNALSTNPSSYATAANFNSLVSSKVSTANSSDASASAPTYADNRSHKWSVSTVEDAAATDGCTPATKTTTGAATSVDAPFKTDGLFDNTAGSTQTSVTTKTQCFTSTVTAQIGTCNVALVLGACVNLGAYVWGNGTALLGGGQSVAQFKVTETVTTTTTTTTSTQATSAFPRTGDVTAYAAGMTTAGPGDLYVEGTPSSTLALVAQDDVIVTNTLAPSGTQTLPNGTSVSNAFEVVAQNDVRVYHPVSCTYSDPSGVTTTAGFCPNDITGLYSGVLSGTDVQYRNDAVYTNMDADTVNSAKLQNLQINGAVFALGNATTNCPKPATGGGFCGGEITADNYNRGASLGTLTITGGMYMAHHGPVGQEWEVADATGATSRPYSGYHLTEQYQSLSSALTAISPIATVIPLTTTSSSLWRIVSVSSAASP